MFATRIWTLFFCFLHVIAGAQQPGLVLPIGHSEIASLAEFSADGKYIITGSIDKTVKLWDARSGTLVKDLAHHPNYISSCNYSPDGKYIVTSSVDGNLKIWKASDLLPVADISAHSAYLVSVKISPDSKYIATASRDKSAKLWELSTGKLLHVFNGHKDDVRSIDFSPDGKYLATGCLDDIARIWKIETGELIHELKSKSWRVVSADFSPDGNYILTTYYGRESIKVWSLVTGLIVGELKENYFDAKFTPDGKKVLIWARKGIKIWDFSAGKIIKTVTINRSNTTTIKFSPSGKFLIANSEDAGSSQVWNAHSWELVKEVRGELKKPGQDSTLREFLYSLEMSKDEKNFVTASKPVKVWDSKKGTPVTELRSRTDNISFTEISANDKYIVQTLGKSAKIWETSDSKIILSALTANVSPGGRYIIAIGVDNVTRMLDTKSGRWLAQFPGSKEKNLKYILNTDGQYAAAISDKYVVSIWDFTSGKLLRRLKTDTDTIFAVIFHPGKDQLYTYGKQLIGWDIHNGNSIGSSGTLYRDPYGSYKDAGITFSPDGNYILLTEPGLDPGTMFFAQTLKGAPLYSSSDRFIYSQQFSPDSKTMAITTDQGIILSDIATGEKTNQLAHNYYGIPAKRSDVLDLDYSGDGKYFVTASEDSTAKLWDAETGKLVFDLTGHSGKVNFSMYSPDGKYIVTGSLDNTLKLWDTQTGQLVHTLVGHIGEVNACIFTNDMQFLYSTANDNTTIKWELSTGKQVITFLAIDKYDYFTMTPTGYYMCTPAAAKSLHYIKGVKMISFEQLDVKYNRPDKVLEAIGNTDTALIRSYRKAWEKRIKKLGIDTTAFRDGYSVPEADFTNRDAIEYGQKNRTLKLIIKATDSAYKLDRFNVWVNETPVFGQRGISIRKRNKNEFDTTITIRLSQGENRIETSIINVNGTESYRMPLIVNYTSSVKQKETTRFIGIGIDQFGDSQYNLQYSTKDIRDLSKKLKEKYKGDMIIDTLFNENVTVRNVKALKQKLLQTTENDKVIIAYSGHGMLSKVYDYYLSTYSVNFERPEQNGLPYDELENLLDSIPARKKLMLIDACHSGEVDKEDLVTLTASSDSLMKGLEPVAYKKEGRLGLKNSFELMQSLFVNVGKSTGATIISAAAGTQFALERNDLKNGVFTYSILEAMNKYPTLKISELKKIVGERVEELTKGLQKPTSRNEMIAVDWSLW